MACKRNTHSSLPASRYSTSTTPREHSLPLSALNPYITCSICKGYLIHATTVIDCLHTFCKSCLLKYFEDNTDCPKCHEMIHQSHPSHYVAFDRTVQDIVYKLVPGLQAEEEKRQEDFLKKLQQQAKRKKSAKKLSTVNEGSSDEETSEELVNGNEIQDKEDGQEECCGADRNPALAHHRRDEHVFLELIPDGKLPPLQRSFIRVSGLATITTIRRLLAYLLLSDMRRYDEYDIFCNNELMGRDFSMAFIQKTRWRSQSSSGGHLVLTYREHVDF